MMLYKKVEPLTEKSVPINKCFSPTFGVNYTESILDGGSKNITL